MDFHRVTAVHQYQALKKPVTGALGGLYVQQNITSFFTLCFDHGLIPQEWTKSIIVPITKGSKIKSYKPLTHRGLAMQSCVYKMYSYLLNRRFTNYLENNNLLNETQNGFRQNRSCVEHVYSLSEAIKMNTKLPRTKV